MIKILLYLFSICAFSQAKPFTDENDILASNNIMNENRTITDETLKKVFEKFKEFIGHDEGFESQKILKNSSDLFINATLSDVHLIDPSDYTVPVARVNMTTLDFYAEMLFPKLNLNGYYEVEAENELFHLIGSGPFNGEVKNLTISIGWKFNLTKEQTLEMEYFDLNYIFSFVKVNITNIGGDKVVSDTLNDLINIGLPTMINVTKNDVEQLVNKFIQHYSLFLFTGMTVDEFVTHVYQFIEM